MGEEQSRAEELRRDICRLEEQESELKGKWKQAEHKEEESKERDFCGRKLYEQMAEAWSGDSEFLRLLEENGERLRTVERERAGMLEKCHVSIRQEVQRMQDAQKNLSELLRNELEG